MRSHGVPSFPDPRAGRPSGVNPQSPAFGAALQACHQLNPKLVRFPDPTPSLPGTGSGTVLGAFNVYFVLGPATGVPAHSPAFIHTASACGVNPRGPAPR
jgi:hypothetical protein